MPQLLKIYRDYLWNEHTDGSEIGALVPSKTRLFDADNTFADGAMFVNKTRMRHVLTTWMSLTSGKLRNLYP